MSTGPEPDSTQLDESAEAMPDARRRAFEVVAICLVLTAAHHAIPYWALGTFTDAGELYRRLERDGWITLVHALEGIAPLILCLTCVRRSGLILGNWRDHRMLLALIISAPVVLTAVIYPMTSRPFADAPMSMWLVSPLTQDLMFSAYIYGLASTVFTRQLVPRLHINTAMIFTAIMFALWHTPNFIGVAPQYVLFQLLYTFIGLVWILIAREITGSIIPVVFVHMGVNYIAWITS